MNTTTSLTKCRHCGAALTNAATCFDCGAAPDLPSDDSVITWIRNGAIAVAGVLALGFGAAWLLPSPNQGSSAVVQASASTAPSSRRHYVDADFYWDAETKPYRQRLVDLVAATWPKVPGCREIDPGTLSYSASRTASFGKGPTFFVTCTNPAGVPFNYWFTLDGEVLDWQRPR